MLARAVRGGQQREALQRQKPLAAYELTGWLKEARPVSIIINRELGIALFDNVIEQNGFRLDVPGVRNCTG